MGIGGKSEFFYDYVFLLVKSEKFFYCYKVLFFIYCNLKLLCLYFFLEYIIVGIEERERV